MTLTLVGSTTSAFSAESSREPLMRLENVVIDYLLKEQTIRAVDGVSLDIHPGEIVGIAGESGCGKSTLAHAIMRITRPPGVLSSGRILFRGEDIVPLRGNDLRRFRWRNVALVFQSAMNALNPVLRVGDQFVDMLQAHERISKNDALARAGDLLETVGIERNRVRAYPHELSGGMRQRVIIAMALALKPELLLLDEPTTALDVVVQREILQEIEELQRELGFAVLFITHDLSLLVEFADRIAVMYAGEIVESAPSETLLRNPQHPYTVGLMASFPPISGAIEQLTGIPGSPPDLGDPPTGCRFHPRCPHCRPENGTLYTRQTSVRPVLKQVGPGHSVACHLVADGGTP
jgi:peptide/nickel transport system ATP-binding protein